MNSDILSETSSLCTLEEVMHWAFARKPHAQLFGVVTQDEFTHDIVICAAQDSFLVFDTN